jgi:hypothetical protein
MRIPPARQRAQQRSSRASSRLLSTARLRSRLCWPSQPARPFLDQRQGFSRRQRVAHAATSRRSHSRPRLSSVTGAGSLAQPRAGGRLACSRREVRLSRLLGRWPSASQPSLVSRSFASRRNLLVHGLTGNRRECELVLPGCLKGGLLPVTPYFCFPHVDGFRLKRERPLARSLPAYARRTWCRLSLAATRI